MAREGVGERKKLNAVTGSSNNLGRSASGSHLGEYLRRAFRAALGALVIAVTCAGPAVADGVVQDATLRALAEAIEQVKARYAGAVDEQKLVADAIRGMVQGLDPYSDYLEPDTYRELKQDNGGRFGGLGMEVRMDAGAVRVVSTFEGSPA